MSQSLLAKNKLFLAKQPLIFITACAVNILIFYLILQLVSNEHEPLNRIDPLNFLDFINYRQTPKIEEHKVKEKEQELPEEAEELPPPDLPQPEIQKPVKTQANLPRLDIHIPLSISGLPYIGDFLRSETPQPKPPAVKPVASNLVPTLKTKPAYPPRALRSGIEGIVTVEFTIAVDGSVKDPNIIKSDPPKIFDRSVLKAIKKWKFNPDIVNGKAVEKRARQDIHFRLQK
ncbi:MAG: TonB family protein [Proteobacteria bacterium]|nr:TonB family protein [Pseudomonadota bacterium]